MKNKILVIIFALSILLTACSVQDVDNRENVSSANQGRTVIICNTYKNYGMEGNCSRSANIYTGKVVDIRFAVYESDEKNNFDMPQYYTIYKVAVDKVYKGSLEGVVYVKIFGVKQGYKESFQLDILKKHGYKYDSLPHTGMPNIDIGKVYLFLSNESDKYEVVINPYECILGTSKNAPKYTESSAEQIIAYLESPEFDKDLFTGEYKETTVGKYIEYAP